MTYIIAEIGINHNGDVDNVLALIDKAKEAGCNAVKFQKRTPSVCVPEAQKGVIRDTPWGRITYLEYREKVEFGKADYDMFDWYCKHKGIDWFASVWDADSADFIAQYDVPFLKIPSALLTNTNLICSAKENNKRLMISTGMSTMDEIDVAYAWAGPNVVLMHTTSTYPCPINQLNLRMIQTLKNRYGCSVGYSGHEVGLSTTVAAVVLGAEYVERHVTLDRSMWGTDQSASVEPQGLQRLVRDIRAVEEALGDGVKRLYESETAARVRLRGAA